jgi:hypothetical protein
MSNGVLLAIAGVVVVAVGFWLVSNRNAQTAPPRTVVPGAPITTSGPGGTAGVAQPPGDPPPGKVWSAEHGHWHDSNEENPGALPPPGDPPPGKVWSVEHGHWHDIGTGEGAPPLADSLVAPAGP